MIETSKRQNKYLQTGFTIVELLVVIVVIGILAAMTVVTYNGIQGKAHNSTVQSDLQANAKNIELYTTKNREATPLTLSNVANDFSGQYKLRFSSGSYNNAIFCRNNTSVVIGVVSKSGKSYKYDTAEGKVTELASGTANTCSIFMSSTSPGYSVTTIYPTSATGNVNGWSPLVDAR